MNQKSTLLLVAAASFAVGIAVDQVAFSPDEHAQDTGMREAREGARKSGSNSRSETPGAPGTATDSRSNRGQQNKSRDRSQRREEDRFPHSVQQIFEKLNRDQPINFAASSKLINDLPSGMTRRNAIERFASHWGQVDPEAALLWTESLSGREKFSAMEHILHQWARTEPAAAAGYAAQLPNSEHSLHLLQRMTHLWAESDRMAALDWSMAQVDAIRRRQAISGVVSYWAQSEPAEAATFASSIDSPYERREVLEVTARRWANRDVLEALDWAHTLPPGDQQQATKAILREIAERAPAHAASLYEEIATDLTRAQRRDREYRHMAEEVASVWASASPHEAATWALGLPEDGEIRRGAVAAATEQWLRLDNMAAGEWIGTLPQGGPRTEATERLVHNMANTNPESAFAWATSISAEGHRVGLMRHTLERWQMVNPTAARAAFDTANVSPDARRSLGEIFGIDPFHDPPTPSPAPPETDAP